MKLFDNQRDKINVLFLFGITEISITFVITYNVSGLFVVALSRNLKLTTTLNRGITQNPCYVPLNLE